MKKSITLLLLSLLGSMAFGAVTKVACVGDSITFGAGIPAHESKYPDILGLLLGDKYEVKNFGNSGKTAGDYPGQTGRYYGSTDEHKAAVEFGADIYICNLGINDTGSWWNPKLFEQGYEKLISEWRGDQSKRLVYVWGKLGPDYRGVEGENAFPGNVFAPKYKFAVSDNGSAKNRPAAEKLLLKIGRKNKLVLLDAYTPLADKPQWYKDGLHPDADGAKRIAEITYARLVRALKIEQPKPTITPSEKALTISNDGDNGILMDGWILSSGNKRWAFEDDTVIHPRSSIAITLSGNNQTDPTQPLECAIKAKPESFKLTAPKKL